MSAFITKTISPLDLQLDVKNPRFILPDTGATENDIILYLLENEKVANLCNRLNVVGTILPGERIVVCNENGGYVVLEENRRICSCKMLLNPSVIPEKFKGKISPIIEETRDNLSTIEVDIVSSRQIAKKYLAARHINGVRDWSTIAKMNFVTEEFSSGSSVEQISDITSLSISQIHIYLKNSNLLNAGITRGKWTKSEKEQLKLTNIEPEKYLRPFNLGLKGYLGITFDGEYKPHSKIYDDSKLHSILSFLIRKTYLENRLDTRSTLDKVISELSPAIALKSAPHSEADKGMKETSDSDHSKNGEKKQDGTHGFNDNPSPSSTHLGKGSSLTHSDKEKSDTEEPNSQDGEDMSSKPRPPKNSLLFAALDCGNIDRNNKNYRGLIAISQEIIKFSRKPSNIKEYSVSAVMLTRCLVEHTFIASLKSHSDWDEFVQNNGGNQSFIKLNQLVSCFLKYKDQYFLDLNIKNLFTSLFENYNSNIGRLNMVVHQLNAYKMTSETLQAIVDEGLFAVIQYLIEQL